MRLVLVIILVVCIISDCSLGWFQRRRRRSFHEQTSPASSQLNKAIVGKSAWTEHENGLKNEQRIEVLETEARKGQGKGLGVELGGEQENELDVTELEDEWDIDQKTDELDLTEQEADELINELNTCLY